MPIDLKCYATLAPLTPPNANAFPINDGETILALAERLNIPLTEVKIVFVNGLAS
ncbi:MAG: MoaD/ThiS family protein, partial [Acidobacteriota bacterium]